MENEWWYSWFDYPQGADADSNGDILVGQYNTRGVKKFVYGSGTLQILDLVTEEYQEVDNVGYYVIEIVEHLMHILWKQYN